MLSIILFFTLTRAPQAAQSPVSCVVPVDCITLRMQASMCVTDSR